MKLLLDTHVLLWAAGAPERLSADACSLLLDADNSLVFSSASLWEIVIKVGLGRAGFRVDPVRLRRQLVLNDYAELPVTADHALTLAHLPPHHKDPFDRILIAQARAEGMQLLSADADVARYGEGIISISRQ